jgi:hypothetical protein
VSRRIKLDLTEAEAHAVWSALDTDISLRLEAARDDLGALIPGESIADEVPAQKRALRKVQAALSEKYEAELRGEAGGGRK